MLRSVHKRSFGSTSVTRSIMERMRAKYNLPAPPLASLNTPRKRLDSNNTLEDLDDTQQQHIPKLKRAVIFGRGTPDSVRKLEALRPPPELARIQHDSSLISKPAEPKLLKACIVGPPNSGKSTLLNSLTGEEYSLVSTEPYNTRTRLVSWLNRGATQLVLMDTPGLFMHKKPMDKGIVAECWNSVEDADIVLYTMEALERHFKIIKGQVVLDELVVWSLKKLKQRDVPVILVITKMDRCKEGKSLSGLCEQMRRVLKVLDVNIAFLDSRKDSTDMERLRTLLFSNARANEWLYAQDKGCLLSTERRILDALTTAFSQSGKFDFRDMRNLKADIVGWTPVEDAVRIDVKLTSERPAFKNARALDNVIETSRQKLRQVVGKTVHLALITNLYDRKPGQFEEQLH